MQTLCVALIVMSFVDVSVETEIKKKCVIFHDAFRTLHTKTFDTSCDSGPARRYWKGLEPFYVSFMAELTRNPRLRIQIWRPIARHNPTDFGIVDVSLGCNGNRIKFMRAVSKRWDHPDGMHRDYADFIGYCDEMTFLKYGLVWYGVFYGIPEVTLGGFAWYNHHAKGSSGSSSGAKFEAETEWTY